MKVSKKTRQFVKTLGEYSGNSISHADDLGLLLELSTINSLGEEFDRIAFLAKFSSRTKKIMDRIGKDAEGFDKLSGEFAGSLEEIRDLLVRVLDKAPDADKATFTETYLQMTHESLQNLLTLLHDLSWFKNWQIDHRDWEL